MKEKNMFKFYTTTTTTTTWNLQAGGIVLCKNKILKNYKK